MKSLPELTGAYKRNARPFHPGQVRVKRWRGLHGATAGDPLWVRRCGEYWERQMRTYGVKLSGFDIKAEPAPQGKPGEPRTSIITTTATVAEVLPGMRVDVIEPAGALQ